MLKKIQELITEIQMTKDKSQDTTDGSTRKKYSKKWSQEEQNFLCDLIVRFGTDFTLIQEYFPTKSRKQVKRKYKHLQEHRSHTLVKMEQEAERQRRKSFFDEEVLEVLQEESQPRSSDKQQQSFS